MFLFENDKCPVCSKEFVKGDDIVVCPECGTPHHRECYNLTHRCANKKLHNTDFKFQRSADIQQPEEKQEESRPQQQSVFAPLIDGDNTKEVKQLVDETVAEGEKTEEPDVDGVSVYDASQVIGVNIKYYLPKFIKKKGLNWNWGAFFFGPLYYFFRKMYMQGFLFLAINFASNVIISTVFSKPIAAIDKLITPLINNGNIKYEDIVNLMNTAEWKNYLPVFIIMNAVTLILSIVMGIFANRMYRKKVVNIVKTVDEKLKDGSSFAVNPMLMGQEADLSQADLRKLFLSKQGGVTWFVPLLIYGGFMLLTIM